MKIIRQSLVVVPLLVISGSVSAEPTDNEGPAADVPRASSADAKTLFNYGLEQGRLGHYENALSAFEEAYRLSPHHIVLFNIGRAAEAVGNIERAISAYESFLDSGRDLIDETTRIDVTERLRRLRDAIQAQTPKQGDVADRDSETIPAEVRCPFPGFSLLQDLRTVARTPFAGTLELQRGSTLSIERPGYFTARIEVPTTGDVEPYDCRPQVDPDATEPRGMLVLQNQTPRADVFVNGQKVISRSALPSGYHLVTISAPGHVSSSQIIEITPHRTIVLSTKLLPVPERSEAPSRTRRDWGIALLGAGIAALGSGLALLIYNEHRYQEWQSDTNAIRALPRGDATRPSRSQIVNDRLETIEDLDVATWAALTSAAALTISGTALLLIPNRSPKLASGRGGTFLHVAF